MTGYRKESGSRRTAPRPKDWYKTQPRILARDGRRCTWVAGYEDGVARTPGGQLITPWDQETAPLALNHPARCPAPATDVDHYHGPGDELALRALCGEHHRTHTGRQAARARWARHKPVSKQREPKKHPGLL